MARKKNLVVELVVALCQIVFALSVLAVKIIGSVIGLVCGLLSRSSRKSDPEPSGRPTFEDFKHTGATKEESFANYLKALGVPPKPKFKDFRYSGERYEESQQNFLDALQDWRDKYEVLVYGHKWEEAEDDGDDEDDDE